METLNEKYLLSIGFAELQDSKFECMNLRYHVKNGLCLFTNEQEGNNSYKVGFAEMRCGKYHLCTLKWIHTIGELTKYLDYEKWTYTP